MSTHTIVFIGFAISFLITGLIMLFMTCESYAEFYANQANPPDQTRPATSPPLRFWIKFVAGIILFLAGTVLALIVAGY